MKSEEFECGSLSFYKFYGRRYPVLKITNNIDEQHCSNLYSKGDDEIVVICLKIEILNVDAASMHARNRNSRITF